jgi:hypothetical protein
MSNEPLQRISKNLQASLLGVQSALLAAQELESLAPTPERREPQPVFMTRDELAEQLRVTSRTLWEWGKQMAGPPVTRIGGRVLYERDAVQAWLKSKQTCAA